MIKERSHGIVLSVRVQPGAKRTTVVGEHDGSLKIALAAPPVDGKANLALVDYLCQLFQVKRHQVEIIQGKTSRNKVVFIHGQTRQSAERHLNVVLSDTK